MPYSRHPPCYKDISFWLPEDQRPAEESGEEGVAAAGGKGSEGTADAGAGSAFHENDVMDTVRNVAGDLVEDVRLVDSFTHPDTGRRSMCYRITYRSLERTLTNDEANSMHASVTDSLVQRLGVEVR